MIEVSWSLVAGGASVVSSTVLYILPLLYPVWRCCAAFIYAQYAPSSPCQSGAALASVYRTRKLTTLAAGGSYRVAQSVGGPNHENIAAVSRNRELELLGARIGDLVDRVNDLPAFRI